MSATNVNFIDFSQSTPITAAWLNNVNRLANTLWDITAFGPAGQGGDDTATFNSALASGELDLYIPPGTYNINGSLVVQFNGQRLRGAGWSATKLVAQNGNLPLLHVNAFLTGVDLRDFVLDRAVPAVNGGNGLDWPGSTSLSKIYDIISQNHYNNFALGPTDYSKVQRIISQLGWHHGIYVSNGTSGVGGPCQWSISDSLSGQNNGIGLLVDGTAGATGGMSLGELVNFSTFANGSFGVAYLGTAANAISGVRMTGGFLGSDNNTELYMDTYGGQHKIVGVEMELAGSQATGRAGSVPRSFSGAGLSLTANNLRVQLSDPNINGCSFDGIDSQATVLSISNPQITNNGLAGMSGAQSGINITSGRCGVVGGYIADTGSGTQLFGVAIGVAASVKLDTVDLTGNIAAPTTGAGVNNAGIVNCWPDATVPTQIQSGVILGNAATGGSQGAGTLNSQGNLFKNGVAFTNP